MPRAVGVLLLGVDDFAGMRAFYRDILRLPESGLDPGSGLRPGVTWARFETSGCAIELFAGRTEALRESVADAELPQVSRQ